MPCSAVSLCALPVTLVLLDNMHSGADPLYWTCWIVVALGVEGTELFACRFLLQHTALQ